MSKQTWTSVVSAITIIVLVAVIALAPVPFVAWSPGGTYDVLGQANGREVIAVSGLKTYPTNGQLRMTTVAVTSVDSHMSLPEMVVDYFSPAHEVLPRDAVYPAGKSAQDVQADAVSMMDTSQRDAVVAALRAAGHPVQELPQVTGVSIGGPSHQKLQPGDLIEKIDQVSVQNRDEVVRAIQRRKIGEDVVFSVDRGGKKVTVKVTTESSNLSKKRPVVGINVGTGYRYSPKISYGLDRSIVGASAGLVLALGIYDKITPGELVSGQVVAGTGELSPTGEVGRIGGIREKVHGAEQAGARVFLVPQGNCPDMEGVRTRMTIVKITTLKDAIAALQILNQPNGADNVPHC